MSASVRFGSISCWTSCPSPSFPTPSTYSVEIIHLDHCSASPRCFFRPPPQPFERFLAAQVEAKFWADDVDKTKVIFVQSHTAPVVLVVRTGGGGRSRKGWVCRNLCTLGVCFEVRVPLSTRRKCSRRSRSLLLVCLMAAPLKRHFQLSRLWF